MYKIKYEKYKQKYLQLKKQIAGTPELTAQCKKQIAKVGKNGVCNKCKISHNPDILNPITNTSISECNIPTPVDVDGKGDPIYEILYFIHPDNPYLIKKYNYERRTFENFRDTSVLMNDTNYLAIKSYSKNKDGKLHIVLYPNNISTFCAEGNIVWVTKESKVGSTGLDSCMFVIIILTDGTKICIHHNMYDGDIGLSGDAKNATCPENINLIFEVSTNKRGERITKDNVDKIYLCIKDVADFGMYDTLINFYDNLTNKIYKLSKYTRYYVDDNNNVYALGNME
jgi:hypothetical protein